MEAKPKRGKSPKTFRFKRWELAVFLGGTLLALAGTGVNDPFVFYPCFGGSWLAFIWLCILHEGKRLLRLIIAMTITICLFFVGLRAHESAKRNDSVLSQLLPKQTSDKRPYFRIPMIRMEGDASNLSVIFTVENKEPDSIATDVSFSLIMEDQDFEDRVPATMKQTSANEFVLGDPVDIQLVCTPHKPDIKPQFVLFTLSYVDAKITGQTRKRYEQELVLKWPGITNDVPSHVIAYATVEERNRFFDFLESEHLRQRSPTTDTEASPH